MTRIITLDGPAGVGKTTLARRLAARLGLAYLDSGAMFRATAFALGRDGWELPARELGERLEKLQFSLQGQGADSRLLLNGEPLSPRIRDEEVGLWASRAAAVPLLREYQKKAQREIGAQVSLLAEGRDMGSVVFPKASPKIFLDAAPEERARRRCLQLAEQGRPEDYTRVLENLRLRDDKDRNRATAPLRPAGDAIVIDTTSLDLDEVFVRLCELCGLDAV